MRPRAWQIGLGLVLLVLFEIGIETGVVRTLRSPSLEHTLRRAQSPAFAPVFVILLSGLALGAALLVRRWREVGARSGYFEALQHPGPEKLVEGVMLSMKSGRGLPGVDALVAQVAAITASASTSAAARPCVG
jgi:hypothetical protein